MKSIGRQRHRGECKEGEALDPSPLNHVRQRAVEAVEAAPATKRGKKGIDDEG